MTGHERTLKILHFSDVHLDPYHSESKYGVYGKNPPPALWLSALQAAAKLLPDPDVLLLTGDYVMHSTATHNLTEDVVLNLLHAMTSDIEQAFPTLATRPNSTLGTVLGNTDAVPDYHLNVTEASNINPYLQNVSAAFTTLQPESSLEVFRHRGASEVRIAENMYLLSISTIIYTPQHSPNTLNEADPFGQFAWLNSTLHRLRKENASAVLVGHVPPAVDGYQYEQSWDRKYVLTYRELIAFNADIVIAQIFGHYHKNQFRVWDGSSPTRDTNLSLVARTPQPPLWVTGSISPVFGNNPSFHIWDLSLTERQLKSFTIYTATLDPERVDWLREISSIRDYALQDLSSRSLRWFQDRMISDDELLERYHRDYMSGVPSPFPSSKEKAQFLCALTWWSAVQDWSDCVVGTQRELETNLYQESLYEKMMVVFALVCIGILAVAAWYVIRYRYIPFRGRPLPVPKPEVKAMERAEGRERERGERASLVGDVAERPSPSTTATASNGTIKERSQEGEADVV